MQVTYFFYNRIVGNGVEISEHIYNTSLMKSAFHQAQTTANKEQQIFDCHVTVVRELYSERTSYLYYIIMRVVIAVVMWSCCRRLLVIILVIKYT